MRVIGTPVDLRSIHHSKFMTTRQDTEAGGVLAKYIGNTGVDFNSMNPIDQWTAIAKALRVHGCIVVCGVDRIVSTNNL